MNCVDVEDVEDGVDSVDAVYQAGAGTSSFSFGSPFVP